MQLIRQFKKYFRIYSGKTITRSYGLLEYFWGRERAKVANKFISEEYRKGRVLDIGCGLYPIFLLSTKFIEKFGIDKACFPAGKAMRRFKFINFDIEHNSKSLPFTEDYFDVITMLAVFEHIELLKLRDVMSEVYRMLKPGGIFIMTVPSTWADGILNIMAILRFVSKVEIADHKTNLSNRKISDILKKANFVNINSGHFECFLNRWFLARK